MGSLSFGTVGRSVPGQNKKYVRLAPVQHVAMERAQNTLDLPHQEGQSLYYILNIPYIIEKTLPQQNNIPL